MFARLSMFALSIPRLHPHIFASGDQSGSDYNFGSANFTIKLAPNNPAVPEASTTVTFGLLLAGLGLLVVRSRKRSAV